MLYLVVMTPADLHAALTALATRRPLFHSEADFQHELAWELRARGLGTGVRLERPFDLTKRVNVDLVVLGEELPVALELKYWPKGWSGNVKGELFHLKNRGAQDLGRYDYWKDVSRIEDLHAGRHIRWGAAIALTNDPAYWSAVRPGTMAEPFRLQNRTEVQGTLRWPRDTGTTRGRETDIDLRGTHPIEWRRYATETSDAGELRYVALVVGAGPTSSTVAA